jgi:hypothetical protein
MTTTLDPDELEVLNPYTHRGAGGLPIPSVRDEQTTRLIDRVATPENRQALRTIFSSIHETSLTSYVERMAALAVRTKSELPIRRGLIAAGIAATITTDDREVILRLPLLWHSMDLLHIDPQDALAAINDRIDDDARAFLAAFASRTPENRTIESMHYSVQPDEDGFRYGRTR